MTLSVSTPIYSTERTITDRTFRAIDVPFVTQLVLRAFTGNAEYQLIDTYIAAAQDLYEAETNESLWPQTIVRTASAFPCGAFELPHSPVVSVSSVAYYDSSNAAQAYGGSPPSWVFISGGETGRSVVQVGASELWPSTYDRLDAVSVTYTAGYSDPEDVPARIKVGLAVAVGELYKNPDLSNDMGQQENTFKLRHFFRNKFR